MMAYTMCLWCCIMVARTTCPHKNVMFCTSEVRADKQPEPFDLTVIRTATVFA